MARGIEVHNGKVVLSDIVKLNQYLNLGQGKTLAYHVYGAKVQIDSNENWDDPSTINHDMHALWVNVMVGVAPTGDSTLLRLESNTKGVTLRSVIDIPVGGNPVGDFEYLMTMNPNDRTAWSTSGDATSGLGARGWLKILAGTERWIQLYAEPSM